MKNSYLGATLAGVFAACWFGFGPALADSSSVNDSAKEVGNNFGELLKGMGQEAKKGLGSLSSSEKKDKQAENKKKPAKDSDNSKEQTHTNK